MSTHAKPWLVAHGVLLLCTLGLGCRVGDPTVPVDGHHELCCRAANPDNVSFVGCRASNYCRATEEVWVRGRVTCGPADPRACDGGRCCELDLEGLDPRGDATLTEPEVVRQTEPESRPEPAPAPSPIRPVPFDGPLTAAPRGR